MQPKVRLNGNAKYLMLLKLRSKLRQDMNFSEVPNVILYINFIMHSSNHHNANIYLFNWIVCNVCNVRNHQNIIW